MVEWFFTCLRKYIYDLFNLFRGKWLNLLYTDFKLHVVELQSLTTICCNLLVVKLHSYFVLSQVFQLLFGSFFVVKLLNLQTTILTSNMKYLVFFFYIYFFVFVKMFLVPNRPGCLIKALRDSSCVLSTSDSASAFKVPVMWPKMSAFVL